jgi:hypothetical protein
MTWVTSLVCCTFLGGGGGHGALLLVPPPMVPLQKLFCGGNLFRLGADRQPSWGGNRWF